jgi:hypothetical protein
MIGHLIRPPRPRADVHQQQVAIQAAPAFARLDAVNNLF